MMAGNVLSQLGCSQPAQRPRCPGQQGGTVAQGPRLPLPGRHDARSTPHTPGTEQPLSQLRFVWQRRWGDRGRAPPRSGSPPGGGVEQAWAVGLWPGARQPATMATGGTNSADLQASVVRVPTGWKASGARTPLLGACSAGCSLVAPGKLGCGLLGIKLYHCMAFTFLCLLSA